MVCVHNTHEVWKGSMKVEKKCKYQLNLCFEGGEIMLFLWIMWFFTHYSYELCDFLHIIHRNYVILIKWSSKFHIENTRINTCFYGFNPSNNIYLILSFFRKIWISIEPFYFSCVLHKTNCFWSWCLNNTILFSKVQLVLTIKYESINSLNKRGVIKNRFFEANKKLNPQFT